MGITPSVFYLNLLCKLAIRIYYTTVKPHFRDDDCYPYMALNLIHSGKRKFRIKKKRNEKVYLKRKKKFDRKNEKKGKEENSQLYAFDR